MGVVGTCFKLVFFVIVPLLVLAVAAFIGYCASTPNPWGTAFVNIFLVQGTLTGTMKYTPEVPSDIVLMPRPANELFATLPSGHKLPMSGIGMCCRFQFLDPNQTAILSVCLLMKLRHGVLF